SRSRAVAQPRRQRALLSGNARRTLDRRGDVLKKILKWTAAVVLVLVVGGVIWIGPRNIIGVIRYDQRVEGKLHKGDAAPDVTVLDLDGKTPVALHERIGGRPLVVIFGSFT